MSETDERGADARPAEERGTPESWLPEARPVALVAGGGSLGAVLRHAVTVALQGSFPWGTLAVNVLGSFALGLLLYEKRVRGRLSAETRLLLGTGFLSSFTTFSTFAVETVALSPEFAVANVAANYALGFAAVLVGRALALGRWSA